MALDTMKALVKFQHGYGNLNIIDVNAPQTKPGNVLIKVHACGVCGSDVNIYKSAASYTEIPLPMIPGHEYAGEIIEIGEEVTNWRVGDRVLGEAIVSCDRCRYCRNGNWHLCSERIVLGINKDGSMAEYISVPSTIIHRLPDLLSCNAAVVAQPCAVAMHALNRTTFGKGGEYIAIFGPGIIGIMAALIAKFRGAHKVVLFGIDEDEKVRLPLAREIGIEALNINQENLVSQILEEVEIENSGFDLAVECSGAISAFSEAINFLKSGGALIEVGMPNKAIKIDMAAMVRNEINILTSYSACWSDYELSLKIVNFYSGQINKLINIYPLSEAIIGIDSSAKKDILKAIITFR